jgi:hypothetical protein
VNATRVLLVAFTIAASWLGMQQVHELGHIFAAKALGGKIDHLALHPLTISHTDVGPNKQPLLVVWAGPLMGTLLPLTVWGTAAGLKWSQAFLLRFFAGFCLVANGVYIGMGSFFMIGDPGEMLRNGSPQWTLLVFGAVATVCGFLLWNGQGKRFGLGRDARPAPPRSIFTAGFAFSLFLAIGLLVGGK